MTMTNRRYGYEPNVEIKPGEAVANPTRSSELEAFAALDMSKVSQLRMPNYNNVTLKNPKMKARWVERMQKNGLRYMGMKSAGFVNVQRGDCNLPDELFDANIGGYVWGDLILMMIPKEIYDGALLHNHNTAVRRSQPGRVMQEQRNRVRAETGIEYAPSELAAKVSVFSPPERDVDAANVAAGASKDGESYLDAELQK